MIEVQPILTVNDMPHEIVNNKCPLSINRVGKIGNFCPCLVVAEVRLGLG